MYKQILVPIDGSQTALAALRHALDLAKAFDAELYLVHVIDTFPFLGMGAEYAAGQAEYLVAANAQANSALNAAQAMARAAHVDCEIAAIEGHAADEGILNAANTSGADLIVIGSHGRRGFERLLLGSVTQRVLQEAEIPVMVVRGDKS